jgi:hypothetical protein
MTDAFPEMPTLRCRVCGENKKKMFFLLSHLSHGGTVGTCRMCTAARNARAHVGNPAPAAAFYDWAARLNGIREKRPEGGEKKIEKTLSNA